ncbi:hypothetical protein TNCT_563231 [Trichonephila clavata]|uniref:Uncharacterized protein n=1 Tax=Trichonephila clavata TaxID=2740835 RepID=A0A8X6HM05_TRICU|nr:hypothetical protein TNCT_563231 [Trichonephila clavata]
MPLKNKSNRARKHPSFNRASKAQRVRRIEEKRSAYIDSSFENNTIAPINEPDLFTRSEAKSLTSLRTPQNALTAEEMSDLPDLCIETSIDCTENCFIFLQLHS